MLAMAGALALLLWAPAPARAAPAAGASPAAGTEGPGDAIESAEELLGEGRAAEALDLLRKARATSPAPRQLLHLARIYARLGQHRTAAAHYQAYLTATPAAPRALRAEAEAALAAAGLPPPEAVLLSLRPPPVGRLVARPLTGLRVGGLALLISGYTVAVAVGLPFTIQGGSLLGGSLLVPVLGPYISGIVSFTGHPLFGSLWGLPWMMAGGTVQIAGLAMMIAGYRHQRWEVELPPLRSLRLRSWSAPGGGGLVLEGKF
jgi:hypothetical protein